MQTPDPLREFDLNVTRRQLFGRSALGLGTAAMAQLFNDESFGVDKTSTASHGGLHHAPKAKRVIYFYEWWTKSS
jgi:hypothetical protein